MTLIKFSKDYKNMYDFSKYIDEDEHILSIESDANFLMNLFKGSGLVIFMISFLILFVSLLRTDYTNIISACENILIFSFCIILIYLFIMEISRFFTKVVLTNKKIIVIRCNKPVFYNFQDVASYMPEKYSGLLILKIKNKILPILSKTDGKIFHEKFLEVYPDFIEEKQKSNPIFTTLTVIYAFFCFFCLSQIKTNEYRTASQTRTEYQQVIIEQENCEYFEKIFKNILLNIDYQKSNIPLKVIVDFYVDDNSKLEKYRIAQYSEDENFNKSIIKAVEKTFPLEREMPASLKKYKPIKMRINVIHNGTNNEFLIKNYSFWFEIFGPSKHTPYQQLVFKHH